MVCFHYRSKVFEHGMFSLSTAMTPKNVYSMFMGSLQKGLSQSTAGLAAIPYCFACKQNHMTLIREWFSTFYDVFDINRPRSEQELMNRHGKKERLTSVPILCRITLQNAP